MWRQSTRGIWCTSRKTKPGSSPRLQSNTKCITFHFYVDSLVFNELSIKKKKKNIVKIIPLIARPWNYANLAVASKMLLFAVVQRERKRLTAYEERADGGWNKGLRIVSLWHQNHSVFWAVIIWRYWLIGPQTRSKNVGLEETRKRLRTKPLSF